MRLRRREICAYGAGEECAAIAAKRMGGNGRRMPRRAKTKMGGVGGWGKEMRRYRGENGKGEDGGGGA